MVAIQCDANVLPAAKLNPPALPLLELVPVLALPNANPAVLLLLALPLVKLNPPILDEPAVDEPAAKLKPPVVLLPDAADMGLLALKLKPPELCAGGWEPNGLAVDDEPKPPLVAGLPNALCAVLEPNAGFAPEPKAF